ncbi:Tfp pilus assembly protein FimT/FimU [Salinivibrio sp. ES.052]|uniref:pilus assembly FimT family protein n=1 Tax=Salinivibrio sp. ES.052 TaxID=1882823 RepID=UPI00092677EC|nr:type II secretion system protein [Salinivibrio sp. ES.052]SIN79502.1 prepilin-type N-terminal cleavage/methylation domain-containing protein [Salinivibrio sp. ES.052]
MRARECHPPHTARLSRGFTMVEMLVVIALMAAVSTMVVPNMWGQYQRFQQTEQIERFWQAINQRTSEVRNQGTTLIVDAEQPEWQALAAKHQLTLVASDRIIIRSDGFIKGGALNLAIKNDQKDKWTLRVSTPDGDVNIVPRR